MRPIGEIIKAVDEVGENPIPADIRYEIIMYLEMLHDLMIDTSYYFFNYAKNNLQQGDYGNAESNRKNFD